MKKSIALITWAGLPEGAESERLLLPLLTQSGVEAQMVDWRNSLVDFSRFDLVVLRSCWDYHLRVQEFAEWLGRTARSTAILNPAETVLWNSNKFYLRELSEQGIEIAPTCFVSAGEELSACDLAEIKSWRQIVVKPAVSASAHNTSRFDNSNLPSSDKLTLLMRGEAFLAQQFIPEIQTKGEISFIYFNGSYSHAVLKRPASHDFRVQKEFGGSAELFLPQASLLGQADEIAATVPQIHKSLYCRIDAVERAGKLVLMELELIEPELFLGLADSAAGRFAEAIARRLDN